MRAEGDFRAGLDELEKGEGEGRRLPRARSRKPQEIPSLEKMRNRHGLDRRGFLVAEGGEGVEKRGAQAQLLEGLIRR